MKKNIKILNLNQDPFILFKQWFLLAQKKEINDPNAMNLSTVNRGLQPTSRLVLMKSFSKKGFIFNTNLNSKKSKDIIVNSLVGLNFYWKSLRKQVRIEGRAIKITKKESDFYFNDRPRGSQIGAWASNQSHILNKRKELLNKVIYYEKKFKNNQIPRPSYWSGYRVAPNLFEFWQDMPFRLHDRIEFYKVNNKWKSRRLYP